MDFLDSDISVTLTTAGAALLAAASPSSKISLDNFRLLANSRAEGAIASESTTVVESFYTGTSISAQAIDTGNVLIRCEIPRTAGPWDVGGVALYSGDSLVATFYWEQTWSKPTGDVNDARYFELILSYAFAGSRVKTVGSTLATIRNVDDLPLGSLINRPQVWVVLDHPGVKSAFGQTWFIAYPKDFQWETAEVLLSVVPNVAGKQISSYASQYRESSAEAVEDLVGAQPSDKGGAGYLYRDGNGKAYWRSVMEGLATPSTPGFSPAGGDFGGYSPYAQLDSPHFIGEPTAPTAAPGTNTTQLATTAFVREAFDDLIAGAPTTLDTLNEIAAALNDDANLAGTLTALISTKLNSSSYTAADVLSKLLTVDGSGSGLDADHVRGTTPTAFGLSRLADTNDVAARAGLGLGTAAVLDVGTSASKVVQLDGSARLPAVDGSQLTNMPIPTGVVRYDTSQTLSTGEKDQARTNIGAGTSSFDGAYSSLTGKPTLGTAAALDVGTTASTVVQLDGSAKLPAVDGSQLTGIPYANLTGKPTLGTAAALDVGTAALKVVQVGADGKLPVLDGSNLTNVSAAGAGAVRYDISQELTTPQQAQGRANLMALGYDSNGYVGIGLGTDAAEGPLHIRRTSVNPINERIDDSTSGSAFTSRKARGTSAAKAAVQNGDIIQNFLGQGYDGEAWRGCANIRWVVDGTPSTGNIPTRLEFWTFTAAGSHTEKARIDNAGNLGIGLTPSGTYKLEVNGKVSATEFYGDGSHLTGIAASKKADRQVFDASGTWTKPSGFSAKAVALIQCWGAGGGAGINNTGNGSGGGGGGYAEIRILLSSLAATEAVSIGAGGAKRASGYGAGSNGGNTTFGAGCVAYGGQGGPAGTGMALGGGVRSAASVAEMGSPWRGGQGRFPSDGYLNGEQDALMAGAGGGSNAAGGTSRGGGNGGGAGSDGVQPGGGGGAAGANVAGGNGGAGRVVVTVFDGA